MNASIVMPRHARRAIFAVVATTAFCLDARRASAQWDRRDSAVSRCQQELQYRMGWDKCLDVEGAKREDGANIQLWGCSGGANQTWLLRK